MQEEPAARCLRRLLLRLLATRRVRLWNATNSYVAILDCFKDRYRCPVAQQVAELLRLQAYQLSEVVFVAQAATENAGSHSNLIGITVTLQLTRLFNDMRILHKHTSSRNGRTTQMGSGYRPPPTRNNICIREGADTAMALLEKASLSTVRAYDTYDVMTYAPTAWTIAAVARRFSARGRGRSFSLRCQIRIPTTPLTAPSPGQMSVLRMA